jgi:hypothetical protein
MRNWRALTFGISALVSSGFYACSGGGGSSEQERSLATVTGSDSAVAVTGNCSEQSIAATSGYKIAPNSALISGDQMTIATTGDGECDGDVYYACWPGIFLESAPPQAHINLVRHASASKCGGLPAGRRVSIDLQPLRMLYQEMNPSDSGGTISVGIINPSVVGGGVTQSFVF